MSWAVVKERLRLPKRYVDLGSIGQGSMGEVRRVRDTVLDCDVAIKLLSLDLAERSSARVRFRNEAEITAGLQHPSIIQVHEYGKLDDGRPWFTMQYVDGRTLRALVADVHRVSVGRWRMSASGWDLRRLVDALTQVASAVGFAHDDQVLHRDVKPTNIMVGRHGEVLLMDWGIAKSLGAAPVTDEVSSNAPRHAHRTIEGLAIGTPPYMPLEQATGDRDQIGPHSDVYGLGAVLYKILSGRAPYGSKGMTVVQQVLQGPPPPLRSRVDLPLPDTLVNICDRAMSRTPQLRYRHGAQMAAALRAWLDQQDGRDEVLLKLRAAESLLPEIGRHRARVYRAQSTLTQVASSVKSWDPVEDKAKVWRLQDELSVLRTAVSKAEARYVAGLRTARVHDPSVPEASEALAEWYRRKATEAEEAGDLTALAVREAQVSHMDTGQLQDWLQGWGTVTLLTEPPGAEVQVFRYEQSGLRLVAVPAGDLGATPVVESAIQRGSYLLRIVAPHYHEVLYPIVVDRNRLSQNVHPGVETPFVCRMLPEGELADDDCYVPAGWFKYGGGQGIEPFDAGRIWVEAFVCKRFHVTVREYLEFLSSFEVAPSDRVPDSLFSTSPLQIREGVHVDEPVRQISWDAAKAYAAWVAERDALPWRLPHELEWEKAARGVDGRLYPWGDEQDSSLSCVGGSERHGGYVPVTDYPTDESVYGVRGMAGNTTQQCLNLWEEDPPAGRVLVIQDPGHVEPDVFYAVRGAHCGSSAPSMQCSTRLAQLNGRVSKAGNALRLVRSI